MRYSPVIFRKKKGQRTSAVFPNGSLKRDPGPLRDLLAHMGPRLRDHTRKRKMRDIWGRLIFARFFQPAPNVSLPDFTLPWVPFRSLFLVKGPFFFKKCRETRYLSREMLTVLFPPISHNSPPQEVALPPNPEVLMEFLGSGHFLAVGCIYLRFLQ